MIDLEERLRATLSAHAADAPPPRQLLHRVRAESRRRRRRRRAGTAGALILASAMLAMAGYATNWTGSGGQYPARDGAAPGMAHTAVRLVPGQPPAVAFPFTPRTSPPGLGEPVVMLIGGEPTLQYGPGVGGRAMTVTLSQRTPTDPGAVVLPVRPGRSVVIRATEHFDLKTLRTYVSGFVDKPLAMAAPFTFELVPAGFTVDNVSPAAVTFAPPGVPPDAGFSDKIAVLLNKGSADGRRVTAEGVTVYRILGDGRTLAVQVPASVALTDSDLDRFAAGIRPTAAAVAGQG